MDPSTSRAPSHGRKNDQVLRALSDQRRRYTLQVLRRHREARLSEIADEVARSEDGDPASAGPADAVSDIRIDLYHRHVPLLVDAGLVDYTEGWNVVAISERGVFVTAYLDEVSLLATDSGHDKFSTRLQQVYEYILHDQHPEAVSGTEQLAQELDIRLERPPRFPEQRY